MASTSPLAKMPLTESAKVGNPMDKFNKVMKKILSVPKKNLKDN
jgi:hypothetical protein